MMRTSLQIELAALGTSPAWFTDPALTFIAPEDRPLAV